MDFLTNNSELFSIIGYALINIFNATTKHWSKSNGVMKVIGFVTEALSFITSANELNGQYGKLKMPGQIKKK